MGYHRKRGGNPDSNQAALVAFARRLGASVEIISKVGHGCPDLLVGFRGQNLTWEVKRPGAPGKTKRRKAGQLRPKQEEFASRWRGAPPETIATAGDVLRSLLAVDRNRPLSITTVPDDTLAAIVAVARKGWPDLFPDAPGSVATPRTQQPAEGHHAV